MKRRKKWGLLLLLVVLAAAGCALAPRVQKDIRESGREAVREAVIHSAVECYTVEGAYPESLSYLEEHYGLVINHRDYIVAYDVFAENQPPVVQVLVRGEE